MASRERPRLLVVDDDPEITSTFEAILRSEGYDVASAQDGVNALELVRQMSFDLILLDLLLPDMDVWTILKNIRQIRPGTRVVILCADVDSPADIETFRLLAF